MISIVSILFVGLALYARADETTTINEEDFVLVLNSKNFDYAIKTYKYLLVEFCMLLKSIDRNIKRKRKCNRIYY